MSERIWIRRREVAKAISLALIVLLAISVHYLADHWIKELIRRGLSLRRELLVRLLYPSIVLVGLVLVKGAV
jgi:hypothetical protein